MRRKKGALVNRGLENKSKIMLENVLERFLQHQLKWNNNIIKFIILNVCVLVLFFM